jgi:hypothetical protein
MTLMDAIRAEVEDWNRLVAVQPSHEVLEQFYTDSLAGGSANDLAQIAVGAVVDLVGPGSISPEALTQYMAVWCSGVLVGARAAKR